MLAEIKKDKCNALQTLKEGLDNACADNITEVLINLEDGTCDYIELIPILEKIAHVDWFCYFDDNGAGGQPHADLRRNTSFKSWALKAIENIKENDRFESSSMIHSALKSNSTNLIKATLEQLKSESSSADKSLIPILEKIARKDLYKSYSYFSGFVTDCQLGELACAVIQIIIQHSASSDKQDTPDSKPDEYSGGVCSLCSSLPDDITVNTGREEYFPNAFDQLIGMDSDYRSEFRCCPGCRTYFNWIDMPQMYGSGNNDEERLVRLSREKSRLLDKLFSTDLSFRPTPVEVDEYISTLPLDLLVPALRFRLQHAPEVVAHFVPRLVRLLGKSNDSTLWGLLNIYVSDNPDRAEEIVNAFRSDEEYAPTRLTQIIHHCLRLLKSGK